MRDKNRKIYILLLTTLINMIKDVHAFREELDKINNWWTLKEVKELKEKRLIKRQAFSKILDELNANRVIIVTGPRRVGKTILVKQTIQELLTKTHQQNILYYSLDDPSLFTYSDNLIKDMIDYFLENIAKDGRKYVFLDETHLYKGWYKWIKSYYDRYEDIKFILTGSSSLALQKEANMYLQGRSLSIELYPLSFKEFLSLNGIESELNIKFEDVTKNTCKPDYFEIKKEYAKIEHSFEEYLLVGGFPEWFEIKDLNKWFTRLTEDIPKKAIYEDLTNLFGLKNSKILELILSFIIAQQSKILSYETINEVAGLDRNTLANYIEYLKSTYLIIEILKYAKSIKTQLKSMKKYLSIDQGLRNALMKNYEINENNIGFIIENTIGIHLFKTAKAKNLKLFYIRKDKEEIDFIIKNEIMIPIEVKYKQNIKEEDTKTIKEFVKEKKLRLGIMVTKDLFKKETNILYIPAWLFLLCE